MERLDAPAARIIPKIEKEFDVKSHQTPGMNLPGGLPAGFGQCFQE
jgi:hypothetical protein